MFKKKKNKIYSLQYDLDAFVVRITNERVDVETRSKTYYVSMSSLRPTIEVRRRSMRWSRSG